MDAFIVIEPSTGLYLAYKDPITHNILPASNTIRLISFILSSVILFSPLPRNNKSTPEKPTSNPTTISLREKFSKLSGILSTKTTIVLETLKETNYLPIVKEQ